ncbi:methylthioribulose 1-phosphate dehydratase [Thermomonas sp.]|jgi:methylthioribulose-1-phosphate dehydratase|uniref:methylthioribulose 1-phosphate dehydratase n=1 Tax=Thermomonas sp. TaxID=1971895 RepID=UPI001B5AC57C|nr:methylthioribulose 1-phosphate dehydratase [Thermomonas sp.]MBK6332167.1 methylthioribulose 1-phosphate dehydratase [Thermomonas sp.]MBK6417226.1 methylthioribulose 1-phosphate dehydratase [Thermomonas sp.]MBK6924455.1 methylthioribulose 1-phosphate dehydratase [Thermomonas sp.]MBK7204493.1 methylthioribulose 1-phosphate dehydratase [Thermomonas sp.]MBK9668577.1 methylthioribulose 1-phosphate dehydratase [Thermomonas sp.]
MDTPAFDHNLFAGCAARIVSHTRELAAKGWTPATAGNFSIRMGPGHAAITISGKDKGRLTEADIMVVDMANQPVATHHRPSAETALHTHLYRRFPDVGSVLHTHSSNQTVAGLLHADAGRVRLRGYELFKALRGHDTHEAELDLAVVPNSQDMDALIASVDALLDTPNTWGYLIAGHGLYAWGHDIAEARRHLDAFEFMLGCELDLRRLRA